ncbi:MAG: hypothetical protein WCF18_20540 [Chthoniobacteraceae bacterium]
MKACLRILGLILSLTLGARAAITIPGANNGTDGVLNVTTDIVIDLSQAVAGAWDADNTANAGKGIYDASKWAVVFKYSSVTVAAGKTVTFTNHPSRAPVVWLVSGNVTIDGTVSLNGGSGGNRPAPPVLAEPGPGGFRGGAGYYEVGSGLYGAAGFGVGGGLRQNNGTNGDGYGGSYGTQGSNGPATYGNPSLIPLLGGSGGSGAAYYPAGGAGGGAILIATANALSISGTIRANGGNAGNPNNYTAGGGSGGGIRLIADTFAGAGTLQALGGANGFAGGLGRIRIERVTNTATAAVTPDPSLVPLTAGDTALLWPPVGAPEVKILSIGGTAAPTDPRASFGSAGADVALPEAATTQVLIETTNVEQAAQVQVRVAPRANANATVVNATVSTVISPTVVQWTATLPVNVGYSAVQVKVVRP